MRHHVKHLELFPTLGLKEYTHLYFALNNAPEFANELWTPLDSYSNSNSDVVVSNFLMNKKRNVKFHLLKVTRENVKLIQQYVHSCSLQRVNCFYLESENILIHHYWATIIHTHWSAGYHGFIHCDPFLHQFSLANLSRDYINSAFT